jgi:ribosomal protein L25 (general stress protein Ctc)
MTNLETLKIFERDNTITPRKLRAIGYVPATIYGKNVEPLSIQLKAHELELAFARGVRKFNLEGLGQTLQAEAKQIQKHSSKGTLLNIEFFVANSANQKSSPKAVKPEVTAHTETPESVSTQSLEEAVSVH